MIASARISRIRIIASRAGQALDCVEKSLMELVAPSSYDTRNSDRLLAQLASECGLLADEARNLGVLSGDHEDSHFGDLITVLENEDRRRRETLLILRRFSSVYSDVTAFDEAIRGYADQAAASLRVLCACDSAMDVKDYPAERAFMSLLDAGATEDVADDASLDVVMESFGKMAYRGLLLGVYRSKQDGKVDPSHREKDLPSGGERTTEACGGIQPMACGQAAISVDIGAGSAQETEAPTVRFLSSVSPVRTADDPTLLAPMDGTRNMRRRASASSFKRKGSYSEVRLLTLSLLTRLGVMNVSQLCRIIGSVWLPRDENGMEAVGNHVTQMCREGLVCRYETAPESEAIVISPYGKSLVTKKSITDIQGNFGKPIFRITPDEPWIVANEKMRRDVLNRIEARVEQIAIALERVEPRRGRRERYPSIGENGLQEMRTVEGRTVLLLDDNDEGSIKVASRPAVFAFDVEDIGEPYQTYVTTPECLTSDLYNALAGCEAFVIGGELVPLQEWCRTVSK